MSLLSELLGGAGTAYITQEGIERARELPTQLGEAATDIAGRVGEAATFRPYTVTAGGASTSFGPKGYEQTLSEQAQGLASGLSGLGQTRLDSLGGQIAGLGNLGQQAFQGAQRALGSTSGQFASQLGGLYASLGEQQILGATDGGLGGLQAAMTTQALQAPTGPSQGLLALQGLTGQADFGGATQDVTGAFRGISASPFQTSTAQQVQQQAMAGVDQAGRVADVSGMFSGVAPSQFTGLSGQVAQQALGQADLGAQARDVTGAFAGIQAPQTRTGAGEFSSGLFAQAMQGLQGETPTAQSVYDQIRAMQTPEEERQRTALENRLAAQGRLGVQTSQYGGTPEQLALEKAQAEARNQASLQALQTADALATSQQARAAQLGQMGLTGEQIQAQLDAEGFGQQMQLGQARLQEAQTQEALQSSVQQRQAQLAQLGLSADQIQNQLISEGFGQQMQLGQAGLQSAQLQSQLQSEAQNRASQLRQQGLSAEQVQNQLLSEGFGQALQLGQAGIQAAQAQSALESQAQARASQLAQLGLSAEQIASQLESEGLRRSQSSAQLAAQLAQTGAGISAQQQQLGQGLLGLGLQAQQLGGQLGAQDIQRAQALAGLGQQAAMLPTMLEQGQLGNIVTALQAAGIPQQQALQALQPALTGLQMAQQPATLEAQALANLGQQQLAGIPSAINAEALLRQAQLEGLTNMLGLQRNEEGNYVESALGGLLGGLGDSVGGFLGGLFGGGDNNDYTGMTDDEFLDWLGGI